MSKSSSPNQSSQLGFTPDEWVCVVKKAQSGRGEILIDMPRGCEPADFVSYILFLALQWRDPSEAAGLLRDVAKIVDARKDLPEPTEAISLGVRPMENRSGVYLQAWHADAQWALQQWQNGAFDGRNEDYVAIYMKDIKGYGSDPVALRSEWAQKCGVVPQRIIVDYIGTEE